MQVPNRVMVPAMVTRLSGEDGFVTQAITDRYVRYAQGEVGLIVVEAMAIHGSNAGPLLRIGDDKFIPGLKEMNARIHDTSDSRVVPQLIHFMKIARSGWRQTVDMLSIEEIDRIVAMRRREGAPLSSSRTRYREFAVSVLLVYTARARHDQDRSLVGLL